jgi:nucleotidyltransferase/DNA polymerase involved in DNA repair
MVSDKVVLHFDMDSFYCQVDSRRLGVPSTAPLVVDQWGMLLSVNYPAKALGISRKTPAAEAASMGAIVAHVCVVDIETGEKFDDINSAYRDRSMYKASLDRYREASEEVMTVMKEALTVPASFERASIDECYVDVSGEDLLEMFPEIPDVSKLCWEGGGCYDMSSASDAMLARGALLGERIRSEVFAVTSFTVSCGVSLTRQVAKLACALNKPNKLTVVARSRTTEFMRSVPIKEIRGLGPRGMETLKQRVQWVSGSTPAGDLWEVDFGSDDFGKWLFDAVRGLNDDPVKETALVAGSVQSSKQFRPSLKPELVKGMLKSLCSDMLERLGERIAKTLVVTLQSGETVRSRQEKFPGENQQVFEMVDALSDKTGLLNGLCKGFDRLAVTAKEVSSDSRAKKEVAEYLSSSRLHFMGTWRTRYLQYVASGDWGEGEVSASTNNVFEKYKSQTGPEMHLLVDMDCFFCSVAMLLRGMDPEAAPVAVASGLGATSEICSANYSARKFGVKAGSFVASARERCPELVLLAIDGATLSMCEKIWKKVIRILALAARNDLAKVTGRSCDEALLDLAGIVSPDSYSALMQDVQETVMKECAVPCSVGISPTRLLAKIATSLAKPRGAKLINSVSEGADLLCGLQVSALPGVGFSTQQKLRSFLGVETVGDLLKHSSELPRLLGAGIARKLVASANGLDPPDEEEEKEMSSVSAEKNFGLSQSGLVNFPLLLFSKLSSSFCCQVLISFFGIASVFACRTNS